MKTTVKKFSLLVGILFIVLAMHAQTPPHPGGGGAPGPGDPPVGSPIDGGLSILLILGAAYGTKKALK